MHIDIITVSHEGVSRTYNFVCSGLLENSCLVCMQCAHLCSWVYFYVESLINFQTILSTCHGFFWPHFIQKPLCIFTYISGRKLDYMLIDYHQVSWFMEEVPDGILLGWVRDDVVITNTHDHPNYLISRQSEQQQYITFRKVSSINKAFSWLNYWKFPAFQSIYMNTRRGTWA